MNVKDQQRLADIRGQMAKCASQGNASGWDSVFLLTVIDSKNAEIKRLRTANCKQRRDLVKAHEDLEHLTRRVSACQR